MPSRPLGSIFWAASIQRSVGFGIVTGVTTLVRRRAPHPVTVTAVADLTPRMRRITVAGTTLLGLVVTPAQDVELILADDGGHQLKRRYTIRSARPELGEFDIDALRHEHGPGGRWAARVAVGDRLELLGPRGRLEVRDADWHLFLGDEAALPAIAALVEAIPPTQPAIVLAEVAGAADELPIVRADGQLDLRWLHRDGHRVGSSDLFVRALTTLVPTWPSGSPQAYVLGESRAVIALRPVLERRGIAPDRMFIKGYWNLGRGGRAAG